MYITVQEYHGTGSDSMQILEIDSNFIYQPSKHTVWGHNRPTTFRWRARIGHSWRIRL